MDDAFLRTVAALQANLSLLDAQSDAFTEFSDMQVLRQLKSRLADYIADHAAMGDIPLNPFGVINERLMVVARFFAEADKASSQLLEWNKSWLKAIPEVGIAELQAAQAELDASAASLPQIQEQLRAMLSPLDWGAATSDLHPELLLCAECCGDVKLPKDAKRRGGLHGFAHGTGELARRVGAHVTAMAGRIRELVALREGHLEKLRITESHIAAHDFRSAAAALDSMELIFTDVPYKTAVQANAQLLAAYDEFVTLERTLEEKLKTGGRKGLSNDLARLKAGIDQPDSELGRECLALLASMESQFAALLAGRRSRRVTVTAIFAVLAALATAGGLYVVDAQTKEKAGKVALTIPRLEKAIAAKDAFGADDALADLEALAPKDARMAVWREQVATVPGTGKMLVVDLGGGVTMHLMSIRPGTFIMGSDNGGDELTHKVTLTKPFYLGKYEVTQEQWERVMGSNPSTFKDAKNPVGNVSWNDCQEFVDKLQKAVPGQMFRLPTEAEWEYACKAGTTRDYAGDLDDMAWYSSNSGNRTHPVGEMKPNAWGLYDMHGNVCEWCADWSGDYPATAVDDPRGPSSGLVRVLRGGGWSSLANDCRVAYRNGSLSTYRGSGCGFRVAAVPAVD